MRSNGSPIVAASGLYVNRVIFTRRLKAPLPPDRRHTCRRHRDMMRIVEVRVEHLESQNLGAASCYDTKERRGNIIIELLVYKKTFPPLRAWICAASTLVRTV
jgi:hypothetical protein